MIFNPTPLAGAYLIDLEKKGDDRGFFARAFCENEFATHGLARHFCQVNNSLSAQRARYAACTINCRLGQKPRWYAAFAARFTI